MYEQAVLRTSLVQNISLIASGMPSSVPPSPLAMRASLRLAMARAASAVSRTYALRARARSMAARWASASSRALKLFFFSPARAAETVNVVRSVIADHPRARPHETGSSGFAEPAIGPAEGRTRWLARGWSNEPRCVSFDHLRH